MLSGRNWKLHYNPDDGDLVRKFYVPALEDARRYDRLTGYFNAGALALASRGVEGLVRNDGVMRMIVGCTLEEPELRAIERGEEARAQVEERLARAPLEPPDLQAKDALELLAWMVSSGRLQVKVAVPCGDDRRPVADGALFHEKSGVIEDSAGHKVAWNGSLNETAAGWTRNWESFQVFTSWKDPDRVEVVQAAFEKLWGDRAGRALVLDIPDAARKDLLRFLPPDGARPVRLASKDDHTYGTQTDKQSVVRESENHRRTKIWSFIRHAPSLPRGGELVGEATSPVVPWPHQARAFERLYGRWPPRLLIADEVGLGKTIQAGMLLRQAWLSKRAKRILVLVPKAVARQWQIELYEKFNLNWPVYDGRRLTWHPSPAWHGRNERSVGADSWHMEAAVIASSQLMRRRERRKVLLEQADPWDLVVLDEAHHARRRGAGGATDGNPNELLRLMRELRDRTSGLVLLTATPMQVDPVELWDLLDLLGLPPEWTADEFLSFFEDASRPDPSTEAFKKMAGLLQATERHYGHLPLEEALERSGLSRLKARKVARALRDSAATPLRRLDTAERKAALEVLRRNTPVRQLVSRHTRELLRDYHARGLLDTQVAHRRVEDRFVEMTDDERFIYEAVEDYISTTYESASEAERRAVGFVMTVYRRRLASSFRALRNTLRNRLDAAKAGDLELGLAAASEDVSDDEAFADDRELDETDAAKLLAKSLRAEHDEVVTSLLSRIGRLPPDSKLGALKKALRELLADRGGYRQAMVFTQYTDTMDFLREELADEFTLMCFSGRGGEVRGAEGSWEPMSRDKAKLWFREGRADILLCTEAAAEGLNFQFCGALVNYDMPWNPMRVEQRIGRIDRLGQEHPVIRIVNLHYEDTVETDIYRVLRERIGLFTKMVGRLQPILARIPGTIAKAVLKGVGSEHGDKLAATLDDAETGFGFDIDAVIDDVVDAPLPTPSPVTMDDLDQVIGSPHLMPDGTKVQPLRNREYGLRLPGGAGLVRVTTDPDHFEEHSDSVELWSPGSALFQPPAGLASADADWPDGTTLRKILNG